MVGVVIGTYQIVRKLGQGGMGAVYLAQHTLLGRRAAIKVLLPALSAQPEVVNRFFNEARAVTSINDPGIVQVFDFGYHTDGRAFIVMEYLEGEPLDRRLDRLGKLPATEALRLCRQIASSLAAAHAQHIIHRDLKPENIVLVRDSEVVSGERSKILDFGIAKLSDEPPGDLKTHTGVLIGTPIYMSPEQCRGLAAIDHRSDIYALGCVLFHLVTGRPPFEGEGPGDIISAHIREPAAAPSSRAPEIPPGVDALVLRCLAKAPADRFQTMAELGAAIAAVLRDLPAGAPASATPPPHLPPTTKLPSAGAPAMPTTLGASSGELDPIGRRRPRLGRWIAAGIVIGAGIGGIAIVRPRGASPGQVTVRETPAAGSTDLAVAPPRVEPSATAIDAAPATAANPTAGQVAAPPSPVPSTPREASPPAPPKAETTPPKDPLPAGPAGAEGKQPERHKPTGASPHGGPPRVSPRPQPPSPAPPPPPPSPGQPNPCGKLAFAAIYNAAAPARDAVRAALRKLNACHAAGDVGDAEFEQTQAALVARL